MSNRRTLNMPRSTQSSNNVGMWKMKDFASQIDLCGSDLCNTAHQAENERGLEIEK